MHRGDPLLMRAMSAAIITAAGFDAVANDLAPAMLALRSESVDSALETVEVMRYARAHNFQWFIIFVAADFTSIHNHSFQ